MKLKMPAGTYWLGDPCYAIPRNQWSPYVIKLHAADAADAFEFKGVKCVAFGTAWGDGEYYDQCGNAYPVDAAIIGLTPISISVKKPFGSTRVTFAEEFECFSEDGVLVFGCYEIDTDPEYEDEEGDY